ncbi:nuclear transport factor 2 family protein [Streptomyces sp. 5-10]|uniref:nuclear transport factor 2 family protein n=1 Tax=Streptomyces sp. 5-10 TaxID=878925 RepID=UPI00168B3BF3|nr:nuclear transport factor 2 family protein [Streptomyces sp. 5-10]MBD3002616.1 nuclear transport factor 2 family protein [Streptomyces sp. 5-10]
MNSFADLPRATKRARMEATIRTYFDGCNEADVAKMAAQFTPDAVHYFPPGLDGPWTGNTTIGENWRRLTLTIGSAWSIERVIAEPETLQAVIEWTHWKTRPGGYLRGDEWYRFDPETGLITEIRAFYASAPDGRSEVTLEGYDYAANGFHLKPPVARPHPDAEYDDTEH